MGFFLFLLVNAALFLRPGEIVPALHGLPIYNVLIVACLMFSVPNVLLQFLPPGVESRPMTMLVVGLLIAVVMSHMTNLDPEGAATCASEFLKLLVYYLLFVGQVTTVARLRVFLLAVTVFILGYALIAVLNFHGLIDLSMLAPVQEKLRDRTTGFETQMTRLRGTSSNFGDPNDICLVLIVGLLLGLNWIADRKLGPSRFLWIAPVALFAWAIFLTQSRGGFLGLVLGIAVLFQARFTWKRAMLLGVVCLPLLLVLFAGRMTSISTQEASGQQRLQIWSEGLMLFREAPLFGIGMEEYNKRVMFVAHNAYLHSYAELGFLGGTLFVGAFYLAIQTLRRLLADKTLPLAPETRRLLPCVLAVIAAYATCVLFLSQTYGVMTYMILGLAPVCLNVCLGKLRPNWDVLRLDLRLMRRLVLVSVLFLAGTYLFVRLFARWT